MVNKMKDILIIAHFTQIPGEQGNSRFGYIANRFSENGHNVELVTTKFSHRTKSFRNVKEQQINQLKYKLTMLNELGYKKNVSLKRFFSHYVFGINLSKYLKRRKKPDIIYCAVPSLDAAYVTAKYARKNNIKLIIDIQDLWPEAFKMIFNIPVLSDIVFFPMKKQADYIYNSADNVVAVSETYLKRGLYSKNKSKSGISVFLGTDLDYFDKLVEGSIVKKPNNEIWLVYIGTLGHSYDLTCVIDALYILKQKGIENIKFIVMGDGPLKEKFKNYAKEKEVFAEFTGRLHYSEMVKILVNCDIAVNPISKGSAGSIINKVGDYAASGLPVINTQESVEYRNLLKKYNAGFNCKNNDSIDLANRLLQLYSNQTLRKELGANNRKLAEEKFNRKVTYASILELVES